MDREGSKCVPALPAHAATPDLADLAGATVRLSRTDGRAAEGSSRGVFGWINAFLKFLHIPKLCVPTGLTPDGRPTAVQLWGRALPYSEMFGSRRPAGEDAAFLCLAGRVAAAIQADPQLRRVDAALPSLPMPPRAAL